MMRKINLLAILLVIFVCFLAVNCNKSTGVENPTKEQLIEEALALAKEFDNYSRKIEKNIRSAKDTEIIEYLRLLKIAKKKGLKEFPGYYK
jgi:hypothetical protein